MDTKQAGEVLSPLFPNVTVYLGDLSGPQGNTLGLMGAVVAAMREQDLDDEADAYVEEASQGDSRHVLDVTRRTVTAYKAGAPTPL